MAALGVVALFMILVLIILGAVVAIAYFKPEEERTGCLLVSVSLFLVVFTVTVWFLLAPNPV